MKRRAAPAAIAVFIIALASFMALWGCTGNETELLLDEDYTGWQRTTDDELIYPIPGHGERLRVIYINDIGTTVAPVADADGRLGYEYPAGTVVVKENYVDTQGTELANLTVMIKAPDDERARRGWIWMSKDPASGAETLFTDSTFCVTCHAAANKPHPYGDRNRNDEFRDYLFYPYHPADE